MLAIFGEQRRIDGIPKYDHDDLARIFRWVKVKLEQLLGSRAKVPYEQRYFVGTDRGMQVSIDPNWLHANWDWYVGVNRHNLSDADCRDLLRPGKLHWKLGSSTQVDLIFKHGLPGINMLELLQPPRALPPHGWIYYEIQKDNAAWKDVLATQSLAMRFTDTIIGNLSELPGQRRLEVMQGDKRAILEFSLFAVQRPS
jgi:predicted component of type VI protein secretion system